MTTKSGAGALARAGSPDPATEASNQLRVERFRAFVSRNKAHAKANGWNKSDVASWIDEDRRELRSQ